jgi:ATP-binding cassette subfamily F protein uup
MLETWPGALVVVSHDRAFLERTVTDVIVLDGKGRAGRVPGGYAAYEAERRAARSRGRVASTSGTAPGRAVAGSGGSGGKPAPGSRPAGGSGMARSASTLRHLMKRAESEMRKLEQRQAALEAELAAAGSDHAALARIGAEMAAVGADLAAAEDGWLALAEEAERV